MAASQSGIAIIDASLTMTTPLAMMGEKIKKRD
jgi:hypothetical protein